MTMRDDLYEVLFDLASQRFEPSSFLIALAALFFVGSIVATMQAKSTLALIGSLGVGALLIAGCASGIYSQYSEFLRLREAIETGNVQTVQGPVRAFRPDAAMGNGAQVFYVSQQRFETRSHVSAAFNHTVGTGGPNLTGECVRIVFVRQRGAPSKIVWLGTLRDGCPESSTNAAE